MLTQHRFTTIIPLLCALLACDTDEFELRSADEELLDEDDQDDQDEASPFELVVADEQAEASEDADADAPWEQVANVPMEERNATCEANCLAKNFAFCFWNGTGCSGHRVAIPGGTQFDFTFSNDLRSLHKRDGTVRVALYNKNGKCLQSVPPGKISLPSLPVGTRRAKWGAAC